MRVRPPPMQGYFELIGDDDAIEIKFTLARVVLDDEGRVYGFMWDVPLSQLPDLISQAGELLGAPEKKKRAKRPKLAVVKPRPTER